MYCVLHTHEYRLIVWHGMYPQGSIQKSSFLHSGCVIFANSELQAIARGKKDTNLCGLYALDLSLALLGVSEGCIWELADWSGRQKEEPPSRCCLQDFATQSSQCSNLYICNGSESYEGTISLQESKGKLNPGYVAAPGTSSQWGTAILCGHLNSSLFSDY